METIIKALDEYMEKQGKTSITPPEGNEYLARIGLLPNYDRSGSQLREYCRNGYIHTAKQPGGKGTKWIIYHSSVKAFTFSSKLQSIVSNGKGEREAGQFFSKHPEILRWAFCRTGGHANYVLKEFPFGSNYIADFVVITSYSGAWEVHLVELEPVDDTIVTKAGTPTKALNKALSQVNDWEDYINRYPDHFRNDLSEWCRKKDLLGLCKGVPINDSGDRLKDSETFIYFKYHIIIGNRDTVTKDTRKRMNQLSRSGTDISTYGRLIDIAKNFDKLHNGERVMLTDSVER